MTATDLCDLGWRLQSVEKKGMFWESLSYGEAGLGLPQESGVGVRGVRVPAKRDFLGRSL